MRALAAALMLVAGAAMAADDRPVQLLAKAETALAAARTPKERLAALGLAAQAQEAALAALRADMRQLSLRARAVDGGLEARERRLRAVLWALERLERAPRATAFTHPGGPLSAARAGMALSAFAPALEAEAEQMRLTLAAIEDLNRRREVAAEEARGSLEALQSMRIEIASLMDRERKRRRLPEEIVERLQSQTAALAASARSYEALTGDLPPAPEEAGPIRAAPSIRAQKGGLTPPAEGPLVQAWTEGREGVRLSVAAYGEVYAPWPGVVRFAGPFGDQGGVVILEPEPGLLMVFGGLGQIWTEPGDLVLQGEPLGAMGGPAPEADEFLIAAGEGKEVLGRETLYVELREEGRAVDPAAWFAFVTEGG